MELTNVVQLIKPEPDSQYRLVNCPCGSDQVVYLQAVDQTWTARCLDCGAQSTAHPVRHDAQLAWNFGRKEVLA